MISLEHQIHDLSRDSRDRQAKRAEVSLGQQDLLRQRDRVVTDGWITTARFQVDLYDVRERLAQALMAAQVEVENLQQLEMAQAREEMLARIQSAAPLLDRAEQAAFKGVAFFEKLAGAQLDGQMLTAQQQVIDQRLDQVEHELSFVTRDAAMCPAAMMTLLAMRENGYELRETVTEQELVSYFEQEATRHQSAVRMAHVGPRPGTNVERWDLLAETCGPPGKECLEEMMDFETSMQANELGQLTRKGVRVCPKDGTDYAAERWVALPQPTARAARSGPRSRAVAKRGQEIA